MFHGSMVALVTPMANTGELDFDNIARLIELHIAAGTQAIVVAGSTGEGGLLTHKEKQLLVRHAVEQVKGRLPIIVGTYAEGTQQTIELTKDAMHAGADACLVMAPAYIKPTQEGLYQHYSLIAHEVAIPLIIYNVPSRTACDILPETVGRLSTISNIIGIKEATGSVNRLLKILDVCEEKLDVYSGDDATACDLMLCGAKGVISITSNIVPQVMAQLCRAALAGDKKTAKQLDNSIAILHEMVVCQTNPIPVKWALAHLGIISESIRLPLTVLASEFQEKFSEVLKQNSKHLIGHR